MFSKSNFDQKLHKLCNEIPLTTSKKPRILIHNFISKFNICIYEKRWRNWTSQILKEKSLRYEIPVQNTKVLNSKANHWKKTENNRIAHGFIGFYIQIGFKVHQFATGP